MRRQGSVRSKAIAKDKYLLMKLVGDVFQVTSTSIMIRVLDSVTFMVNGSRDEEIVFLWMWINTDERFVDSIIEDDASVSDIFTVLVKS
jgi:hypothetical protein